jgi:hypothetical protein
MPNAPQLLTRTLIEIILLARTFIWSLGIFFFYTVENGAYRKLMVSSIVLGNFNGQLYD